MNHEKHPDVPFSITRILEQRDRPQTVSVTPLMKSVLKHGGALARGAVIRRVLSAAEASTLIQGGENVGFRPCGYRTSYRSNKRLIFFSPELAAELWDRTAVAENTGLLLAPIRCTKSSFGERDEGVWRAVGLNPCFRFCRYDTGGFFGRHCDAVYRDSRNRRSFLTYMVYLNENFEGGSTDFFDPDSGDVLAAMRCRTGSALCFSQSTLLHGGATVSDGQKWILRTDVMFERDLATGPVEGSPRRLLQHARDLLHEAEDLENGAPSGDDPAVVEQRRDMLQRAAGLYRTAFKLDPTLEERDDECAVNI